MQGAAHLVQLIALRTCICLLHTNGLSCVERGISLAADH